MKTGENTMKTAFAYARFSSKKQRVESIQRQLERAQDWCERNKVRLDDYSYQDLGVSGFHGTNTDKALGAFIKAVEAGEIKPDYLIIEELDRLTRIEPMDALALVQRILKLGITIVTTADTPQLYKRGEIQDMQLVVLVMQLMRGHAESKRKSNLAKPGWSKRREQKKNAPYLCNGASWLDRHTPKDTRGHAIKTTYKVNKEKAKTVKLLFNLANEGKGVNQIVRHLNENKVATIATSKSWNTSFISLTLRNRAVIGEYQPRRMVGSKQVPEGETISNFFPAIVPESLFYSVQDSLRVRGKNKFVGRGQRTTNNLFSGLLQDARDGSSLIYNRGNNHGKAMPFLCNIQAMKGESKTPLITLPYQQFEDSVLLTLKGLKVSDFAGKASNEHLELQGKQGELNEVKGRIEKIQGQMVDSDKIDVLLPVALKLDAKRKELEAAVEALRGRVSASVPSLDELFDCIDTMNDSSEREAIRERLIAKIRQLVKGIKVWISKHDRPPEMGKSRFRFVKRAIVDMELVSGTHDIFFMTLSDGDCHTENHEDSGGLTIEKLTAKCDPMEAESTIATDVIAKGKR